MKKTRNLIVALLLAATMLLGMAGCGGGGGDATFTMGSSASIDTLNPLTSYMTSTFEIFNLVYDPLVRFDENQEFLPCLAESWEMAEDNLTWTFKLAEGVKWHDGEAFTSEDVKYTYELVTEYGQAGMYTSAVDGIASIECPDDNTVVFTTENPKPNMLYGLLPIMPKHFWEGVAEGELETHPNKECIGTGPFKYDSEGEGFLKLVRNDDYFGTVPAIESFVWVTYENQDSMAQAVILGELDGAMNLNASQMSQLDDDDNVTVQAGVIPGFIDVGLNCYEDAASGGNPLLLIKEVRQAIELATDKQKILDMIYGGLGEAGTTFISPGTEYHLELSDDVRRDFDTAAAAKLLEDAGYTDTDGDGIREVDGVPLQFEFITIADNTEEFQASQIIASGCEEAGIKMDLVTMDSGALYDKLVAFDFDLFIWGWGADIEPTAILNIMRSDQIGDSNEPGWSNAEFDALWEELQSEMEEGRRIELAHQLQAILYEECPYILLLYDENLQAYRSDRWTGVQQVPPGTGTYFMNNTYYNYVHMQPAG